MRRTVHVRSAALMATGLLAVACGNSSTSTSTSTVTVTGATSGSPTSTTATVDLPSLLPVPAGNQRADGPDPVGENGIHKHFLVNGAPTEVMNAYKTTLEGGGWSLTVQNSGGGGGGGGATYTGTNGTAYGVFSGGGYGSTTDIDACVWPAKPADTNCGQQN